MRKLWYAGAALTGGFILFAASPAQADRLPGTDAAAQQADARLADLLGQSNGLTLGNPLGHSSLKDTPAGKSPVAQFKAGQNSPDLKPLLPGEGDGQRRGLIPGAESARDPGDDDLDSLDSQDDDPSAQDDDFGSQDDGLGSQDDDFGSQDDGLGDETGAGFDDDFGADEPDADVAGDPAEDPLFGPGALPLLSGLLPSGQVRDFTEQPTAREAERFGGGMPLLGGLGGLLPANSSPRTLPATGEPDVSGLPAGGVAIFPAATPSSSPAASAPAASSPSASSPSASSPAASSPAASAPAPAVAKPAPAKPAHAKPAKPQKHAKPAPTATPDDPRLHEEPVETDDEAAEERPFTEDGRPVAGVDEQYR
ncbi:hypothetical protein OWR29_32150 [Actinoplanes sp. Pm04-4]|uniref:Uncharacterized protein n=1 Tax=Paractinoplanes pyxinae TaxID=2997416 RepID=A0ABT4B840_9ACTN|nr:hypothetical protein [Actinoplanes pyxinae]MCY1142672.1 hypothetical protein [Actinoplanes pyxinae]